MKHIIFKQKYDTLLIKTLGISQNQIKSEVHFINDLGIDSLDLIELTMIIEKEFKILIPDTEAEQLNTIGEVEDYIKNKLNW